VSRRALGCAMALLLAGPSPGLAQNPSTIERIKPSIVAVGTFERLRNPQFSFAGTGFAVGDGSLVATNEHVLSRTLNTERSETIAIAVRAQDDTVQVRMARKVASDASADLALLRIDGAPFGHCGWETPMAFGRGKAICSPAFRSVRCSGSFR